jgi:DNA polymerase-3 subunit delta'
MLAPIIGHDAVFERFRRALRRGRLASTFLFVGPAGIGKRLTAFRIAQSLLCETFPETALQACGECPSCLLFQAGTHPDFTVIQKPADRATIPVELFVGDREERMQAGLCHAISLKPFRGGRKIAVIDDADYLNVEGANCLLKTLEEPPPRSLLILIGTSEQKQLPTIRSRCQTVRFRPFATEELAQLIVAQGIVESPAEASTLAELANGSLQRARDLADGELRDFRIKLLKELPPASWATLALAKELVKCVEGAGKEAAAKRGRFRLLIGFATDFYEQLMNGLVGAPMAGDKPLRAAVQAGLRAWPGTAETAADCLDTCLTMEGYIDQNANLGTLAECWLDELSDKAQVPAMRAR